MVHWQKTQHAQCLSNLLCDKLHKIPGCFDAWLKELFAPAPLGAPLKNCQLFQTLYATYNGAQAAPIKKNPMMDEIKLINMAKIFFMF